MKSILLMSTILWSTLTLGNQESDVWYSFCISHSHETNYCSSPEKHSDDTRKKCEYFMEKVGSRSYQIQLRGSMEEARAAMRGYCDVVKDDIVGSMYACQYETLCPNDISYPHPFSNKAYAGNDAEAINTCTRYNQIKTLDLLKEQSVKKCFFRLVVTKI